MTVSGAAKGATATAVIPTSYYFSTSTTFFPLPTRRAKRDVTITKVGPSRSRSRGCSLLQTSTYPKDGPCQTNIVCRPSLCTG